MREPSETGPCADETCTGASPASQPTAPHPKTLRERVLSHPWVAAILCALVLALAALYAISENRKSPTTASAMKEASARFSIYLVAEGLQAYKDSTGTFPATLEQAGLDEEGIQYVTDGSSYRLIAVQGSTSLVYVEGTRLDRYEAAFKVLEGSAVR